MEEMLCLPEVHNLDYLPLPDTTLMEDEMGYFWPYREGAALIKKDQYDD